MSKAEAPVPERKLIDRIKKPLAVIAGVGTIAAGGLFVANRGAEHNTKALEANAERIVDRDTGCYDFGENPVLTARTEVVDGTKRTIIEVPIRDTSTHKPGQDRWYDASSNQETNLLDSGFTASYPVIGGEHVSNPIPGEVQAAAGTTSSSTAYNLELGVATETKGPRIANIYYVADAAVNNQDKVTVVRGERLCGQVGFTVEPSGSIADLHSLQPSEEVGKLHVMHGSLQDFPPVQ